ncbi:uncharacterized protein E0L32_005536 [Thyridium curvatum]|uniref:Protein-lysine N-methyltransferase EFM4 n=1 Tax=Thyridium curvatum TaxID=1093900 RepID=A0A507BCN0_9PEZI|nr:uncharacterized protein E0L32_005536 [Thyridium curvatum]TPX14340.1 hypothetical protein E0L32_005536 [Thyridium curvatum]
MAESHPASTNTTTRPAHLEPSKLGTKQYWDALYARELTNHAHDPADKGTVWFDDSDAEAKLVAFLDDPEAEAEAEAGLPLDRASTSFLDLGCGNGSLLLALREDGWRGRLLGVDYSAASVELARQVAASAAQQQQQQQQEEQEQEEGDGVPPPPPPPPPPEFAEWDVLNGGLDVVGGRAAWDVVLDKGTFDAVSLSAGAACEGYGRRVLEVLREGGVFLVTSCNWTEAELRAWFEEEEGDGGDGPGSGDGDGDGRARLVQVGRVNYPSFSFGGVKGQTISTVCFMKKTGR